MEQLPYSTLVPGEVAQSLHDCKKNYYHVTYNVTVICRFIYLAIYLQITVLNLFNITTTRMINFIFIS